MHRLRAARYLLADLDGGNLACCAERHIGTTLARYRVRRSLVPSTGPSNLWHTICTLAGTRFAFGRVQSALLVRLSHRIGAGHGIIATFAPLRAHALRPFTTVGISYPDA